MPFITAQLFPPNICELCKSSKISLVLHRIIKHLSIAPSPLTAIFLPNHKINAKTHHRANAHYAHPSKVFLDEISNIKKTFEAFYPFNNLRPLLTSKDVFIHDYFFPTRANHDGRFENKMVVRYYYPNA
jgi:hypothetical protein